MPGVAGAEGQPRGGARREAGIDPVCHTLVGAALARSGLGRRTGLGTATLVIGANLPDIDVLAYLDGPAADLAFRRGWTHGIPALVVLPFVLTAAIVLFDRVVRRVGRSGLPSGVAPRAVLLLSTVAILTHPVLDTLNTYGVRWLMPLRGDWFYGDTLFIVDPWLWLMLGLGVVAAGRGRRAEGKAGSAATRQARAALAAAAFYVLAMAGASLAARGIARRELSALGGPPVERIMVGPRPLTPFVRQVVAERGDSFLVGTFRWFERPHIEIGSLRAVRRPRPDDPALLAARADPTGGRFLGWARFPVVEVEPGPDGGSLVHLIDLRYADHPDAGFGTLTVALLTPPRASPPPSGTPSPSTPTGPVAPGR
ncbi:MAG: metal-dependent hydrolase [Gemmatimonadales bacterium]